MENLILQQTFKMLICSTNNLNAMTYSRVVLLQFKRNLDVCKIMFCIMLYQNTLNSRADYSWGVCICQSKLRHWPIKFGLLPPAVPSA